MSNVVTLRQSQDYLLSRAERNRRAGRYDEAMALLSRLRGEYGPGEALEMACAAVYEEIGCDEEAARAYLRVVRARGALQARALYHLALLSSRRADVPRALSYLARFAATDREGVPAQDAQALFDELSAAQDAQASRSRAGRARELERRAVERIKQGKDAAAERTLRRALSLHPSAQTHTLLACCYLMDADAARAAEHAEKGHALAPGRVQTLCVLTDALFLLGKREEGRRALYLAALRAKTAEDLIGVALESAKHGEDALTLRLTRSALRREPFNTRAMQLRACALVNLGRGKEASRLFGRLCGLLPEDTVSEYYYRATRKGGALPERLSLGLDVPRAEAAQRALTLVSGLYAQAAAGASEQEEERAACRLCAWAFRSAQAGEHVAAAALMLMGAMNTPASREVLLDALTDPQLDDGFKLSALQVLTSVSGLLPYDVDMNGRLVRVAAGGVAQPQGMRRESSVPVQRACDALSPDFPDAPGKLMPLWIAYLNAYGPAKGVWMQACAAALQYAYHERCGRKVSLDAIARRCGVSARMCRACLRRLDRAQEKAREQESKQGND